MSSIRQPAGTPSLTAMVFDAASASKASAMTPSTGSTSLPEPAAIRSLACATASSSTSESPMAMPCAAKKVLAMPPPIRILSAFFSRLSMTPILSEILAPPRMATKGRSGFSMALPRKAISFSISRPATAGIRRATPSVEACARWAEPKASFTKTSPRFASFAANSGSFFFSAL